MPRGKGSGHRRGPASRSLHLRQFFRKPLRLFLSFTATALQRIWHPSRVPAPHAGCPRWDLAARRVTRLCRAGDPARRLYFCTTNADFLNRTVRRFGFGSKSRLQFSTQLNLCGGSLTYQNGIQWGRSHPGIAYLN